MVSDASLVALMSTGDEQGHKNEFVFGLRLSASAAELHDRYKSCEDKAEHEALVFVPAPGRDAAAGAEVPTASLQEVLGHYPLTDVTLRALRLLREMRAPEG